MKRAMILLLVLLSVAAALAWNLRPQHLILSTHTLTLPADGATHQALTLRLSRNGSLDATSIFSTGIPSRILQQDKSAAVVEISSPVNPATSHLTLRYRGASISLPVHFTPDSNDRFNDGTPDFLRLHTPADRTAFRTWFTALADIAAALPPTRLPHEIDDCAALLRWSYRNALHAHDEPWLQTMTLNTAPDTLPSFPSVAQYAYPFTPLGADLFRVHPGPFQPGDPHTGAFAQFADAKTLWQRNTFFVTRDIRHARPGDLLFYRQLEQNSPFHSMILTGPQHEWAVYHTGPIGREPGEIRRVALDDLLHHPDTRWRPIPENSNFLGVYRWNILREDLR